MQKADSIPSDGTKADSEQKDENLFVSSHDTKPHVVGSQIGTSIESVNPEIQSAELDKKVLSLTETLHKEIQKFEQQNKCAILLTHNNVQNDNHRFRLVGCMP